MKYIITSYLKFLKSATNQHGVHSPFVYTLITNCFYDRRQMGSYKKLSEYRKSLRSNESTISVTDYGAGSRIFKSNVRKVSAIAKHAGATSKRTKLLARCMRYFNPSSVLELGTSLGLGTAALASVPTVKVTSLEGCPATAAVARKQLREFGYSNVDVLVGRFRESAINLLPASFDVVYFDGNHSKKATLEYVELLMPTVHNETVWIFDDIHWSPEMTGAWEEIKAMESVTVTIDCFWLGFVFFRKEQAKEHFKIRL
jgi:predicted O-methyltransferase YrrM